MKYIIAVLAVLISFGGLANAFDKEKLSDHLRKTLNEPPTTKVTIGDPQPTDFGDVTVLEFTVHRSRGGNTYRLYLNPDGKKYILGSEIHDLAVDPIAQRIKDMNLDGAPSKGSDKAPVTVVEFADFQCFHCKRGHTALSEELHKNYGKNEVRLVFKHYPLSNHKWAPTAGVAAECARDQKGEKGFWTMTDAIFAEAGKVNDKNVREKMEALAKSQKLNSAKFSQCMDSPAPLAEVQQDKNDGLRVGVRSTPTFFVNGVMVTGFRDFETFKPNIDAALEAAKKK